MATPPPKPPRRNSNNPTPPGQKPQEVFRMEDFVSPPNKPRKKKKKTLPLDVQISRAMFIVGMVIGGFMSFLLPFRNYTVAFGDHQYTIPFNVVRLHMWQRWIVYCIMVILNGFLWSKASLEICNKYFPQTRGVRKAKDEEYEVGRKIFRLDD